ncbi:carbohydrate ABC transporter permease [Paenibacillus cisolokensis]|uniref:carbohydrate ABC transporter permease n=1 Tax=Paenibacillus cisolokensis TaxID=1658519 RepID=UPI003D2A4CD0
MFKRTTADKWFDFINMGIISIWLILIMYPLYFIVIASFTDPTAIQQSWLWPKEINFEGYKRILQSETLWLGYKNSFVYLILGTSINVLLTLPAAYALSRKDMGGRNALMLFITFTMFFSGGLIPTYLTVKSLNMVDTIWAMVIPNAVGAWNLIIARTFFQQTIPDELLESAKIDGCSDIRFFLHIAIPISKALVAVMILFYGVGHWNAFLNALIYLRSDELYPLQLVLRNILIQNQISTDMIMDLSSLGDQVRAGELIKYGVIIMGALPMLVLYPFLQKYFVQGVLIGSIKG